MILLKNLIVNDVMNHLLKMKISFVLKMTSIIRHVLCKFNFFVINFHWSQIKNVKIKQKLRTINTYRKVDDLKKLKKIFVKNINKFKYHNSFVLVIYSSHWFLGLKLVSVLQLWIATILPSYLFRITAWTPTLECSYV